MFIIEHRLALLEYESNLTEIFIDWWLVYIGIILMGRTSDCSKRVPHDLDNNSWLLNIACRMKKKGRQFRSQDHKKRGEVSWSGQTGNQRPRETRSEGSRWKVVSLSLFIASNHIWNVGHFIWTIRGLSVIRGHIPSFLIELHAR